MAKKQNCFIVYIKTVDIYKDIEEDVETRFDTSNYELDRPLPTRKNKKVIGLMKDELGGKIITKFVGLRAKLILGTLSNKDGILRRTGFSFRSLDLVRSSLNFYW